eukprot:gene16754-34826_t
MTQIPPTLPLRALFDAQHSASRAQIDVPLALRRDRLGRLKALIDQHSAALSDVVQADFGVRSRQLTEVADLFVLRAAIGHIARDELPPAFKMLARVSKIMEQLVHAWDVLATMTPPEYSALRPYLAQSSGFQSHQYRCIEFAMGNKNAAMLKPHAHSPERLAVVQAAYEAPSLYDEALRLLARRGIAVPTSHTQRDWTQPYEASDAVEQAWLQVYRNPKDHWDLYQLGEELTDLEDTFRLWRFRHVTTVERVIGFRRGTGGTSGVSYLRAMLDVVLFPEIWTLRSSL